MLTDVPLAGLRGISVPLAPWITTQLFRPSFMSAHVRRRHLHRGIVRGVVDVARDLAVNADRLNLAEEPVS